jgi:hypothetical protein
MALEKVFWGHGSEDEVDGDIADLEDRQVTYNTLSLSRNLKSMHCFAYSLGDIMPQKMRSLLWYV